MQVLLHGLLLNTKMHCNHLFLALFLKKELQQGPELQQGLQLQEARPVTWSNSLAGTTGAAPEGAPPPPILAPDNT